MDINSDSKDKPVLSPDYYLDNFLFLIDYVADRYSDILKQEEFAFIESFRSLHINARKLYVRLISRKGPYFRKDKIHYAEIENVEAAIKDLAERQFISVNPGEELGFALQVLTRPELIQLVNGLELVRIPDNISRMGKQDLSDALLEQDERLIWKYLEENWQFLLPRYVEIVSLFFLLFFGNNEQTLAEFILEEIGALRYERYEIRKKDRLFNDRAVIDGYIYLSDIKTQLWMAMENSDLAEVYELGNRIRDFKPPEILKGKYERSCNEIGRFLERNNMVDDAISYFSMSKIPPARERIVRILEKTGQLDQALLETESILKEPANNEEQEFAVRYREKLRKASGLSFTRLVADKFETEELMLEKKHNLNIEEVSLNYYLRQGLTGIFAENAVWTALFGLAFWEIIFMPVPGVFFNPFQRGPADLFSPEFKNRRARQIRKRIMELESNPDWNEVILDRYDEKFNTANYLVPWKRIDRDQLIRIIEWIPENHISDILVRMIDNLKDFRSGFPDLILFYPEKGRYTLVEVKGPGDQLRPNQKRWLRFFKEKGIPYRVLKIKWL